MSKKVANVRCGFCDQMQEVTINTEHSHPLPPCAFCGEFLGTYVRFDKSGVLFHYFGKVDEG